jgi:hypothetical protein
MAGSIMASFKSTLLTQLQAASGFSGVQVSYADPGEAMRRECVYLGDIDSGSQIPESFSTGTRRRIEDFTLDVFVAVQGKPTSSSAEVRAVALANVIDDVVANDPQLGGLASLTFCEVDGMSMVTNEAGVDGAHCVVTVRIHVQARLA